ncbi:MAG: CocE/NonD family hydrolase [Roseburia sp.]|nr:CocE/NonD family hydrolase [Roseburia sp.]MCM1096791.1 CocE/NonD family hydrolase [Ruminococcus flavefaciens]
MRIIKNFSCVTRDQIKLATDLYLPDEEGRYPVILMRTPYNKEGIVREPLYEHYPRFVEAGYVVAIQDCRGTCASEGKMNLNGGNEHEDGYDAVEFLSAQPFCDGSVGMFGLSYFGFTQLAAASGAPAHLKAICPFMCCSLASFGTSPMQTIAPFHLGWAYNQLLEHIEQYLPDEAFRGKMLPLLKENRDKLGEYAKILPMNQNPAALLEGVPMLKDYLDLVEGVEKKEFWDSIHSPISYDGIHTAMLCGTGWMDAACNSTIDNYMAARKSADSYTRENAFLLIGPWTHGGVMPSRVEDVDFGEENSGEARDVAGTMLHWFNRYLKQRDEAFLPDRVYYFMQGSNDWHTAADWPPPRAESVKFYLAPHRKLEITASEAGEEALVYDPMNPAPSAITDKEGRMAMADWSEISDREDILEFRSDPFTEDLRLAGRILVNLYAATDVPDTDFVCRLTDISPDGRQRQIAAGYVRARHRNGLFTNDFLTPGETVLYRFGIGHAAYRIPAGHAVGIQLSGSMFPGINRNLNTKEPPALGSGYAVAHDRIFFGGEQASCLDLPILR